MFPKFNDIRQAINNSPYLAGITMILLNIGSKYVEYGFIRHKKKLSETDLLENSYYFLCFYGNKRYIAVNFNDSSFCYFNRSYFQSQ